MIAFYLTVLVISVAVLGMFFYYLNQRLEAVIRRLIKFDKEMETLYANQKVLEADMKKIHNDFQTYQTYQKEIAKIQQRR